MILTPIKSKVKTIRLASSELEIIEKAAKASGKKFGECVVNSALAQAIQQIYSATEEGASRDG